MIKRDFKDAEKCFDCTSECSSLFASLRKLGINSFDQFRKEFRFSPGNKLPLENRGRIGFYCIQDGHVRIATQRGQKESTTRICGPSEIVGYGVWHSTTGKRQEAVALDHVKACFFDVELFLLIQEKNPEISQELLKFMCKSMAIRDERITYLENYSVKNRVAATLFSLNRKFGKISEFGSKLDLEIDRETLAQLAGTVIESLSRVLTDFEKEKVILREGRSKIHIVNMKKLEQLAEE